MVSTALRSTDRIEQFIAAIDNYEPRLLERQEDAFRLFARLISRTIDGRYLERHPPGELLPDLEHLMSAALVRGPDDIVVRLTLSEGGDRGVLVTCMTDRPFLFSTVLLTLERSGLRHFRHVNSIVPIRRDEQGHLAGVALADAVPESFVWIEVEGRDLRARQKQIEDQVRGRLEAVQVSVRDFKDIKRIVQAHAARAAVLAHDRPDHRQAHEDAARLLRWLLDENFVFFGTRYLARDKTRPAEEVADLGTGRFDDWRGIQIEDAELAVHEAGGTPPYLWIRKSRNESHTYRPGPLDHLLVQCWDAGGRPAGLLVVEGLFSFQALVKPRTDVPLLDRMIEKIYAQLQASKGTHRYRTIRNAFNSLPMEYLFTLEFDDVRKLIEQLLEVNADSRLQVSITTDELQSFAFVFVAVPRVTYSDELRADVRKLLLDAFKASAVDDGVYAGDPSSVTFHYFLTGAAMLDAKAQEKLRAEIDDMARPWSDRLYDELARRHAAPEARRLHGMYREAFPSRYREDTSIARAVTDIELLEAIEGAEHFDCDLYREKDDARTNVTRLRMFQSTNLLLSDILPVLDNFGLIVMDEFPTTVHVPGRAERVVATFRISGVQRLDVDLLTRKNRLRAAIRAVISGAMESEPLNRLLLRADIPWTYVVLVSAYQNYAQQIGSPYTAGRVQEALEAHTEVLRALTELFRVKFDPTIEGLAPDRVDDKRLQLCERTRRTVQQLLDSVEDFTSDQVLRTLYDLVEATVRTNFFARNPMKAPELVLKLDPSRIPRLPDPKPYREIYVHHPKVAALHLRGGPIARGGIRWSDRRLDFRTEVLGLMATQNLKNVLIVPRGAKGAFVLKKPPLEAAEKKKQAEQLYRVFIDGILSVTDNLVEGAPVHPPGVLCHDGSDHYLVVAADKGTAHLSDTANGVAASHHFWLGDAFASGGSQGYDHKKEAITARGAWECVKRHFRETGKHPEKDRLRAVGIGDMSGDVFGNGMLRSRTMQLVAAFDHRDIFIDPNPDPAKSFEARQRLFDLPASSWKDYPKELLSVGGGVFPRGAKAIKLSPEAREALGAAADVLSGPDLVKAILRAPVDLLWNGGIGTYIKASTETHLDVSDPTNDQVRVDATEVRAKVVAEGGNLGITQLGRVELASRGVRLNTDAVDNSAGVDLSDHEVNLKILFQAPLRRGVLAPKDRDREMERIKEEVCRQVLDNNWVQSRMISLDELRSRRDMPRFRRAIAFLAERVPFNRREMNLPGERIIAQRMEKGEGLYRPELAILAANAKLDMRQELVSIPAFDIGRLEPYLLAYFPKSIVEKLGADVREHPLAINMSRTILTNKVVGDAGASWLAETTARTGRSTEAILEARFFARDLLGAQNLKHRLYDVEAQLDTPTDYRLRLILEDAIENVCNWILRRATPAPETFSAAFAKTLALMPARDAERHKTVLAELVAGNVPEELARNIVVLERVHEALDIAQLATETGEQVERAAAAVHAVGEGTGLLALIRSSVESVSKEDLERPARVALRDQLRRQLVHIAGLIGRAETDLSRLSPRAIAFIDALERDLQPLLGGRQEMSALVIAADRIDRRVRATFTK